MYKFNNFWIKDKYNFKKFWIKNKSQLSLDNELIKMIDCFIESQVNEIINFLNIKNLSKLKNKNLENYSTSIAKKLLHFY